MALDSYYQPDLAWIHHVGYSRHVESTSPGIVKLLRTHGLGTGDRVLDVGCGSGLLARALLGEGFVVHGVDASPAMIELARANAIGGRFDVVKLPTGRPVGAQRALSSADAVVSTGHVLNYLDSRDAVAEALKEIARALRPGGILALDLMTEHFCAGRDVSHPHCKVEDDWAIFTRYSRPADHRFDREITVFRRLDGTWRRTDEHHRNVTYEADSALQVLAASGITARSRTAFGEEKLRDGLVVLIGVKNE
jgi:SAM-dependent methyltransferase